jgi:hypothetical protein
MTTPHYQSITLRMTGTAPLIMHSSRLADPLDPASIELSSLTRKRAKTQADHELIAQHEWYACLWLDGGYPCIPSEVVEAAFVAAAKTQRAAPVARAGLICPRNARLIYDGPEDLRALWADPRFRLRATVRVGSARTVRTRPIFPAWSAEISVHYLPSLLDRNAVVAIWRTAAFRCGFGDWRPRFGRFRVEEIEPVGPTAE